MSVIASKTFHLLESSSSVVVDHVLIEGLACPDYSIQEATIETIFARRSRTGCREILKRYENFSTSLCKLIIANSSRITLALRDMLLEQQVERCQFACRLICRLERYDFIPTLLRVLERKDTTCVETASETLLWLTENLYARLRASADEGDEEEHERLSARRRQAVADLYEGVVRFQSHDRTEVLDAYLILAAPEDESLTLLIGDRLCTAHRIFMKELAVFSHDGVFRLLLELLEEPELDPRLRQLIFNRQDREFIDRLLEKVRGDLSPNLKRTLRRMKYIPWLAADPAMLDSFTGDDQAAIVRVAMETKTSRNTAFEIVAHLLLHGKTVGRRAAAEAMASFTGVKSNSIVVEALEDNDPIVLASLLKQLRKRGIPGVFPSLLTHLDHPDTGVQQALRESLDEFSINRFLAVYDNLDEPIRKSMAQVVQKLDPETTSQLHEELLTDVPRRTFRALAITRLLDLAEPLEAALIHLLTYTDDPLLRAESATLLATCYSKASRLALESAIQDNSTMVRSAAARSLKQMRVVQNK